MKCSVGVIGALPSFRTNIGLSLLFAAFCIKHPAFNLEAPVSALQPLSLFASLQLWQTRPSYSVCMSMHAAQKFVSLHSDG